MRVAVGAAACSSASDPTSKRRAEPGSRLLFTSNKFHKPKPHGRPTRRQYEAIVPTVADRIAQTVVRSYLEPEVEPMFHPDSYGYRPGRSALDAVATCRKRCWKRDWVIDLDIRAFFDSIPHSLMLKAVSRHTDLRWVILYIERWLVAPLQREDGTLVQRDRGTPQGSLCTAAHKEPYEQCRVMRSVGPLSLVKAASGTERCT